MDADSAEASAAFGGGLRDIERLGCAEEDFACLRPFTTSRGGIDDGEVDDDDGRAGEREGRERGVEFVDGERVLGSLRVFFDSRRSAASLQSSPAASSSPRFRLRGGEARTGGC